MKDIKVITITKEDLMKATAKAMECKFVDELTKEQPLTTLLFVAFSAELSKVLFEEEEEGAKHE